MIAGVNQHFRGGASLLRGEKNFPSRMEWLSCLSRGLFNFVSALIIIIIIVIDDLNCNFSNEALQNEEKF